MIDQLGLSTSNGPPSVSDEPTNTRFIAYVLKHHHNGDVTYMTATAPTFFIAKNPKCPEDLKAGHLYSLHFEHSGQGVFSALSSRALNAYTRRELHTYMGKNFHGVFIRSLMLGVNVLNYTKYAATIKDVEPLVIRLPKRPDCIPEDLAEARFVSEAGDLIEVLVDEVAVFKEHLELHTSLHSPTSGYNKNSSRLLHYPKQETTQPPDPTWIIINELYRGDRRIVNHLLIDMLYGDAHSFSCSKMDTTIMRFTTRTGQITLSPAQSEAVNRFLQSVQKCPAMGVQGCPGSGKSLLVAIMAIAYTAAGLPGLQLALAPTDIALNTIEQALVSLRTTNHSIIRLEKLDELGASSFSIMNHPDKENNKYIGMLDRMKRAYPCVSDEEQKQIREYYPTLYGRAIAAAHPDVILGTIDQVLWMLIDKQPVFRRYVGRVLVDESNQVSEATLTALHQSFPDKSPPMFAFFGDDQQLAPKGFEEGSIVSNLAASSAMELLQRKRNTPLVRLQESFRHTSNLMPYGTFYGGSVTGAARRRGRNDDRIKLLEGDVYNNCALITVDNEWKAIPSGDSFINDHEINALLWTIEWLRYEQIDPNSVLIITYFYAQQALARAHVHEGYEVVTVEEAQGREAAVTIVLTTLDHVSANDAAYTCERRCVVATSRHREALIVIGPERLLASTGPWMNLLHGGLFTTVVYDGDEENEHDDGPYLEIV